MDGAEVTRDAVAFDGGMSSDRDLYFGAGKELDAGSFWSGLIDDVRIYDRVVMP